MIDALMVFLVATGIMASIAVVITMVLFCLVFNAMTKYEKEKENDIRDSER